MRAEQYQSHEANVTMNILDCHWQFRNLSASKSAYVGDPTTLPFSFSGIALKVESETHRRLLVLVSAAVLD